MENQDLRKAGLKVTLPRMKILEILERSTQQHLSAEDLYRILLNSDEEIGLATIYRVLTQFEGAGLVMRHHFEGGQAVFELDRGKHHDHLICIKCGKIVEFVNSSIEEQQNKIAEDAGFKITDHSLIIYGECNSDSCEKA
jgi:Fur family ferric uptake transcriptional regulator